VNPTDDRRENRLQGSHQTQEQSEPVGSSRIGTKAGALLSRRADPSVPLGPGPVTTARSNIPGPAPWTPEAAAAEEERNDQVIRAFIASPENQEQTNLLRDLNNKLTAVLSTG
jgi:hypothetical protein